MISLSSLAAFSNGASSGAASAQPVRDRTPSFSASGLGGQSASPSAPAKPSMPAMPMEPPTGPMPRGSLLNLTV